MKRTKTLKIVVAVLASAFFLAQPASAGVNLTGAGATFPIPLLDACKAGFAAATGNSYTYTGGGSGAGRSASDKGIGDFNFSDTPHTASTRLETVIHIPVVAAPIAVIRAVNTLSLKAGTTTSISCPTFMNGMSFSGTLAFSHIIDRSEIENSGSAESERTYWPGPTLRVTMVPPIGDVTVK